MAHKGESANIHMLRKTLDILTRGSYEKDGHTVRLKLTQEQQKAAVYYDAAAAAALRDHPRTDAKRRVPGSCRFTVEDKDSFSAALEILRSPMERPAGPGGDAGGVLVLNFANSQSPGGGVRFGARAQEEDLCRKSSLLRSLESSAAAPFYRAHQHLGNGLATDAMVLSPTVEIIRDGNGDLLPETAVVSVLTCAAPDLREYAPDRDALEPLLYDRIMGMLQVAAAGHYGHLVLGAWGCGAFGNDPDMVSDAFSRAFRQFRFGPGMACGADDAFDQVVFAIPHITGRNYQAFSRNFPPHRPETEAPEARHKDYQDRIRGSLIGGAAGDALGYPVEFMSYDGICRQYGKGGIQGYALDPGSGKALISDDTQMTMFTICGILSCQTRRALQGAGGPSLSTYVYHAYLDWLTTQTGAAADHPTVSWILACPELHALRAPGNTCLSALSGGVQGTMEKPVNHSKGCGGVMRAAPLALTHPDTTDSGLKNLAVVGAQIAAITHGHPMGHIPAAYLTILIHLAAFPPDDCTTLRSAAALALERTRSIFGDDSHFPAFADLIGRAVSYAEEDGRSDPVNIHALGEGWVGDEAAAIAVYCAVKYEDDFTKALIAAVNHSGDSDSTGAITGNILGAWLGYDRIEPKWKQDLELADVILELADDLCRGCRMTKPIVQNDPDWTRKYIDCGGAGTPQ